MENSIYGSHLPEMKQILSEMTQRIESLRKKITDEEGMDPVEHFLFRLKTEESMREKCRRNNLPETTESALHVLRDAIGLRIVCAFIQDVYRMRDAIVAYPDLSVVEEKDYIKNSKSNGYRSYHLILKTSTGYFVEIQLRTASMDTWAALEHHLKYKKQVRGNQTLIEAELKRCADELASTDVSMQAIRDLIFDIPEPPKGE